MEPNRVKFLTLTEPEGTGSDSGGPSHQGTVLRIHGPMSPIVSLFPADSLEPLNTSSTGH